MKNHLDMEPHKELAVIESYRPDFINAKDYFGKARIFAEEFYDKDIKSFGTLIFVSPFHQRCY